MIVSNNTAKSSVAGRYVAIMITWLGFGSMQEALKGESASKPPSTSRYTPVIMLELHGARKEVAESAKNCRCITVARPVRFLYEYYMRFFWSLCGVCVYVCVSCESCGPNTAACYCPAHSYSNCHYTHFFSLLAGCQQELAQYNTWYDTIQYDNRQDFDR